jgi:ABC-type proline/glycine betaine transport system permease subunit
MPLRPTEADYFLTWLWFFILTTIGGAAGAALIGAATGGALGALGVSPDAAIFVIGAGSFVVSALISFFIFRLFVRRLVARTLLSPSEPANVA